jgi:hypothetical protein
MIERLPTSGSGLWIEARSCLGLATLSTFIALAFLTASLFPAKFRYIAADTDLLGYAEGLDSDASAAETSGSGEAIDAQALLKASLDVVGSFC